jgi:hypothetical protein
MATKPPRLGQSLVDSGRLEQRHLRAALDEQQGSGRRLGDILVRRGYVGDGAVARSLESQLTEGPLISEAEALALVDPGLARARAILPLAATDRTLRLAVSDPLDQVTLDELRFSSGHYVAHHICQVVEFAVGHAGDSMGPPRPTEGHEHRRDVVGGVLIIDPSLQQRLPHQHVEDDRGRNRHVGVGEQRVLDSRIVQ